MFAELARRIEADGRAELVRNEFEASRVGARRIHEALGFRPVGVDDALDPSRPVTTFELVVTGRA